MIKSGHQSKIAPNPLKPQTTAIDLDHRQAAIGGLHFEMPLRSSVIAFGVQLYATDCLREG